MALLDLDAFEELARATRLGEASVEAARLVMVDGKRQAEAGRLTGLHPQAVSRAMQTLQRAALKLEEAARSSLVSNPLDLSRALAVQQLRDLKGDDVVVRAPRDNDLVVGMVLLRTDHHLIQSIGKDHYMLHELSRLERVPAVGKSVELKYQGGMAHLVNTDRELVRNRGERSR